MREFAVKVSPFSGEYGGEAMGEVGCGLAEGSGVNLYWSVG